MIIEVNINNQPINTIKKEVDVNITKLQNQKAIECLKDCAHFITYLLAGNYDRTLTMMCEYIDNKIKELEGEE